MDQNDNIIATPSPHNGHSPRARWVVLGLAVVGLLAVTIWADLQPVFHYHAVRNRVKELVPLGSNIDDAEKTLRDAGLQFYGKHFATVYEDYYWIEVKVHHTKQSIVANMLRFCGVHLHSNYVVIEAGLDNKVRKIY